MAAGSHAEKGIWALLVILARIIIKITIPKDGILPFLGLVNLQSPAEISSEILIRMPTSPTRLVRAVIIPALYDLLL